MTQNVHWRKRWVREELTTGFRRVLTSKEGYEVHECQAFGGLPARVYALRDRQTVISSHRKRGPALQACERDARTTRKPK